MFCHKCGTKAAEGASFCPKCGEKLIRDGDIPQAPIAPASEPLPVGSTSSSGQAGRGLHSVIGFFMKIGGISLGLAAIYAAISGFLVGSVNPVIVAIGLVLGVIGTAARVIDKLLRKSKILAFVVVGVVAVAIIAIAIALLGGNGLSIGNDKYVQMVKGGTLDGYPQKTVGDAFDDFLDNPRWESGLSEDGERFVNVKGGALYADKEVELVVQFFVDEKSEAFQYNACEINGVPQNNLIFWGLLEAIYSNSPASATGVPQNASSENRIEVGETQTFDGRLEVTLEYVEFVSQIQSELAGAIFPEDGNIFLRAAFTVRNIGTNQGGISPLLSTVTYDNSYEFDANPYSEDGNITDVNPLAEPSAGSMSFEVSSVVAESDKSLVINISENVFGGDIMSFVVRPDASTSKENGTSNSYPNVVSYKGISISYLLGSTDDVIGLLGDSPLNDEFKLRYDDLEFYHDNGTITSIVSFDPSLFEADGIPLNKNREGLISIFGQPSEEGGEKGSHYIKYNLPECSLFFELGELDSEAWRISISPNAATEPVQGELLYNGEPIAHLLGSKLEELDKVFGAPIAIGK